MRAGCPPRRPPPTRGVRALASSSPHPPTGCRLTAVELETRLDVAASTRRLDLSECGLTSVPPAVLELTGLEDLSLAGNAIEALPAGLAELPLVRLQLAGNRLTSLPPSLGRLTGLEGLWVHGNALTSLPDGLDGLVSLRTLSAAGNALAALPPSFAGLTALAEAGLAGNALRALPCELEGLVSLAVLKLNGNALAALPPALGALPRLKALALQANPALASLPPSLASAPALADLNAADCGLTSLPDALASAPALATATFYGNRLAALPPALAAAPALERLWLEGNPLAGGPLEQLVVDAGRAAAKQSASSSSSSSRRPLRVGLDDAQAASIPADLLAAAGPAVSVSGRAADAPGYWKLERGGPPSSSSSRRLDVTDARGTRGRRALVVAFGSAPGEPNWGGLLARLRADAAEPAHTAFDVLYVVDGGRSWYGGGGEAGDAWAAALAAATAPYGPAVVLLGDSMGATAALALAAAAPPGSSALAFCPQVDLASSSIRPAEGEAWTNALKARVLASTAAALSSGGRVAVHVGSWQHDVDQAAQLAGAGAIVKVWGVPSHRLAAALDGRGELLPLVRRAVLGAMGFADGRDVRVANVL